MGPAGPAHGAAPRRGCSPSWAWFSGVSISGTTISPCSPPVQVDADDVGALRGIAGHHSAGRNGFVVWVGVDQQQGQIRVRHAGDGTAVSGRRSAMLLADDRREGALGAGPGREQWLWRSHVAGAGGRRLQHLRCSPRPTPGHGSRRRDQGQDRGPRPGGTVLQYQRRR